jgi:hypothetical protein
MDLAVMALSVRIIETDGDVVELVAETPGGLISVITTLTREADDLVLRDLHVDGPGAGTAGPRILRELVRILGRQAGARRVIIAGGTRTTGANPGHTPRLIIIETGEP